MSVNLKEVKEFIIGWNEDNTEEFYKVADEIWENPELSMQEYKSSALLEDLLEKHGFQVECRRLSSPHTEAAGQLSE